MLPELVCMTELSNRYLHCIETPFLAVSSRLSFSA